MLIALKQKFAILQQIRNLKSELHVQLRKLEDDLIVSLEGNHKSEDLNLQNQEARCHSLITAIENDLTQYDLVMTHGSEAQKVIMLHNMEKNQNRYLEVMSEYKKDIRDVKIGLNINTRLTDLITELKRFGLINVTRTKHDFPSCHIITQSQQNVKAVFGSTGTPLKNRKAVKVSEFCVKVREDKISCHITDILTLQGAKHILVDRANSKIKVYGEHFQFQESRTIQENPWNACILKDSEIAVTVPNINTILVIGIGNKMRKIREIKTRLQCWGIAVVKDQLVITTYTNDSSVLILDMTGKEIRTVRPDNYQSEKLLSPWYANINKSETIIYVSYSYVNKMVAYNTSWNALFTYTNQDMNYAGGIDTDREGNIYLCGYNSYNVQQISADGNLIKTLITKREDKIKPRTLRFCRDLDRFIVAYYNCDIIEVYDMCD
ncbi:hypothetical protein CHS0354_007391 [Potamilus streckersoni]|uniref:Uncharacterized protein n=1 Tax=Potamilus streckersoni TaxID=2493646 RepID=A0AAE0TE48_9BIVA|nr:hypothetical protein CHS0354_007391 [Potamilus streckersoni]